MTQAWQVREMERERFLESLMLEVEEKEEEKGVIFLFDLAVVILGYLKYRSMVVSGLASEKDWKAEEQGSLGKYFSFELLPRFKRFSRTQEEQDALITLFLDELLDSALLQFERALSKQAGEDPQTIFGADSATAEVDLLE